MTQKIYDRSVKIVDMTTKSEYDIGKEGIMEQRYTTFSLLLINISRCVQKIKNVEMAALGLKGKQVQCLFWLYHCPEGESLTRLGEMCGEDKGMMSRTIKELAAEGLVYVDVKRERKYKNPIRLTEKGEHIAQFIAEKISAILEEGSFGISEDERAQLYRSLGLISENLSEICKKYDSRSGSQK